MDLEAAWLEHTIQVRTHQRQVLTRKPPSHVLALSGLEIDLPRPLKLQQRPSDARDWIAHKQERCRLAVDLALVMDGYRHLDRVAGLDAGRLTAKIVMRKAAVGEAVAKRKLWRRRQIEIGAGIVHSGRIGAASRKLIVEYWRLPNIARPAHGQSAGRVEGPRQNVGDRVSGLMPKKPRRQYC